MLFSTVSIVYALLEKCVLVDRAINQADSPFFTYIHRLLWLYGNTFQLLTGSMPLFGVQSSIWPRVQLGTAPIGINGMKRQFHLR